MVPFARRTASVLALVLAPLAAVAAPPAGIAPSDGRGAEKSFERFARSWLGEARESEREHRVVQPGAQGPVVTYRDFAPEFTIEVRRTGHPRSPWVGILRYDELLYACEDLEAGVCSLASTLPVTEIFRYRAGRWGY